MLRSIFFLAQLPFPGDAGGVASRFELVGECSLSPVQESELYIVTYVVLARHDLGSRWRTKRIGKAIRESNPPVSQFVQIRCFARFASVD